MRFYNNLTKAPLGGSFSTPRGAILARPPKLSHCEAAYQIIISGAKKFVSMHSSTSQTFN